MLRNWWTGVIASLFLGTIIIGVDAVEAAPETSIRPQSRALNADASLSSQTISLRPQARGFSAARKLQVPVMAWSPRPPQRPRTVVQQAMARQRDAQAGNAGGLRGVQGAHVGPVPGRGACGIVDALRVTAVSGVRLSQPALLDIPTTQALQTWVDQGVKPAIGTFGGGLASLRVAAHYVCRTRNHQPGARLSEHSFGKAIDISAFVLRNGETITVRDHWGRGRKGRILNTVHNAACGPFGTVLGPNSDRFHRNHFHLDTARYRSGPYCR